MAKPKKGGSRIKGQPALYSQFKKRVMLSLTETGIEGLDELAEQYELSRSELVEQIGRGLLVITRSEAEHSYQGKVLVS